MFKKLFKPFEELSASNNNIIALCWLLFIIGSWIISSYVGTTHLFPTVGQTLNGFVDLWSNQALFNNIVSSLGLFTQSLIYSVLISSIIVYLSPLPIIKPFAQFITTFRFLPLAGVSLYISFIIHNARTIQVSVLVIFMSLFLITSMLKGLDGITQYINHAKTIGCTRWEILLEVVIKGRLDYMMESIRQNLAIIWSFLALIEMINTAGGGLGFLIGNNQRNGHQAEIIALQIVILVIGRLLDYTLIKSRKLLFKWSTI